MQTRKYEAIKSNHNCFLCCRVLLQNHFLSSPNNTDGYLFLKECTVCRQTAVNFCMMSNEYFIEFARSTSELICTDAYVCVSVLAVMHQSPTNTLSGGEGSRCRMWGMHPLPHTFLVTVPTQTLPAPPSRAGRPLSASVWMKSKEIRHSARHDSV